MEQGINFTVTKYGVELGIQAKNSTSYILFYAWGKPTEPVHAVNLQPVECLPVTKSRLAARLMRFGTEHSNDIQHYCQKVLAGSQDDPAGRELWWKIHNEAKEYVH